MRVLLVTTGTAGDLMPLIAIGKGLRARGHEVVILGNGYYEELACRERLGFVAVLPADEDRRRIRLRSRWTRWRAARQGGDHLLEDVPRVYDAILTQFVRGQTVVAAAGLMFGARIAQEKHGLPLATVHLYPFCFRSVEDPLLWPPRLPRFLRHLILRAVDRAADRRFGPGINAFRARLGLPEIRGILQWWNSPQRVLALFPAWLSPPQPDWPAQTLLTGFAQYDAVEAFTEETELEQYLAAGEPPLVFSHSSAVEDARPFFRVSIAAAERLGRRTLVLTPHAEQLQRPLPPNVRHFRFVPHSHLLPHSAALVHHGGINTASQALAAGIPQLIVPMFLDQPDNGRRLTRLGVAATLHPFFYRPRLVCRKLRQLLDSPHIAERCRHYAARLREENAVEAACAALEKLHAETAIY
jgi:rhamnosyltransferase subunit B